jgi:hypothetical protein
MYPYYYRSRIGLICLIFRRYPVLLIILLVILAVSSELRGCDSRHDVVVDDVAIAKFDADVNRLCETGKIPASICNPPPPLPPRSRSVTR